MIGKWQWYEVALFAAGTFSVIGSLFFYPWRRYQELWNEPQDFATRASIMFGVGLIGLAGLLASIRDGQQDAALICAGLLGLSAGMLLASWAHMRMIRQLLANKTDALSKAKEK